MFDDGIEQVIVIVLVLQYFSLSVVKYQKKIKVVLEMNYGYIDFVYIDNYYIEFGYIIVFVDCVWIGIQEFLEDECDDVYVIFLVYSLLVWIIKEGDFYVDQFYEMVCLVVVQVGLIDEQWLWSYQLVGCSFEFWLGLQFDEYLCDLNEQGIKKVVSIVIGFVFDYVEILFDIDIVVQEVVYEFGMMLVCLFVLNIDLLFIGILVSVIECKVVEVV